MGTSVGTIDADESAVFSCGGCSVRYWGDGVKLIYRHYATLYFVFAVDKQESDLGILDLIQGGWVLVYC